MCRRGDRGPVTGHGPRHRAPARARAREHAGGDAAGRAARRRRRDRAADLLRVPAVLRRLHRGRAGRGGPLRRVGAVDALRARHVRVAAARPRSPPCARSCRWRERRRRGQLGVARKLPRAVGAYRRHVEAACEVAQMLTDRLGLPPAVQGLFAGFTERWDGKGALGLARGEEIPLAVRIVHVARDATFQRMIAGPEVAAQVVRSRAGHAFDPGRRHLPRRRRRRRSSRASPRARRGTACSRPSRRRGWCSRARRSTARCPRWATSPTWPRRTSPATRRGWRRSRARPPSAAGARPGGRAPRGVRPRPRAGRGPAADLAQAGAAGAGRVGARAAARLPLRARARPLAVPRRAGVRRHRPPRAPRRLGLPPRGRRRRAAAAGAPPRRGRRLLRDDRAAGASRAAVARRGGGRRWGARRAPGGSTSPPSPRCSRRPGSRCRGWSGRPG